MRIAIIDEKPADELTQEEVKDLQVRAGRNDAEACYRLALHYTFGKDRRKNKARKFLEKAASLDHPMALFNLANERLASNNPHAAKGALALFQRAADMGMPESQVNLGNCYGKGLGCEVDMEKAVAWYTKAAEQGYHAGMLNLGSYHRARFEKDGGPEDREAMLKWLRQAAEGGSITAQTELYDFFLQHADSPEEKQETVRWCTAAAEQGNLAAMHDLALFHYHGEFVEKDLDKMQKCLHKAAEAGFAHSQYNLGVSYLNGTGVGQDVETGIMWLEKSAAQGDIMAVKALEQIYSCDTYGRNDPEKANHWFDRAIELGDEATIMEQRCMFESFRQRMEENLKKRYPFSGF